jgi:hypothetical protein
MWQRWQTVHSEKIFSVSGQNLTRFPESTALPVESRHALLGGDSRVLAGCVPRAGGAKSCAQAVLRALGGILDAARTIGIAEFDSLCSQRRAGSFLAASIGLERPAVLSVDAAGAVYILVRPAHGAVGLAAPSLGSCTGEPCDGSGADLGNARDVLAAAGWRRP